jgi:hypothetical protein
MKEMLLSHSGEKSTFNYVRINDLILIQTFRSRYIVFIGLSRSVKLVALRTLFVWNCYISISFDSISSLAIL